MFGACPCHIRRSRAEFTVAHNRKVRLEGCPKGQCNEIDFTGNDREDAMSRGLRIVVTGLIAQYPLGGVTWDYVQYVLGLARMGHDVYYFEDTGQWPYNPIEGGVAKGCDFNVQYLSRVMSHIGLGGKWAYRFPWHSEWFGLSTEERRAVISSADLLINVSGTLAEPEKYRDVRCMVYIDSDPVFTQIKISRGQGDFRRMVDTHDAHFSFGEGLPADALHTGHHWRATRQPIVLSEWRTAEPRRDVFTTVMNWTSYKPVVYEGKTYGQKDVEFMRFIGLPQRVTPAVLEIAVNTGKTRRTPRDLLAHKGWQVVNPDEVCPDMESYRRYIETSFAEWSVAKNAYVVGKSGWFSCRSACYLAAGKPVVVQDTGFSSILPVGRGILPFTTLDEAADAINEVCGNYDTHSLAARVVAEDFFDSHKVLGRLLDEAFTAAH